MRLQRLVAIVVLVVAPTGVALAGRPAFVKPPAAKISAPPVQRLAKARALIGRLFSVRKQTVVHVEPDSRRMTLPLAGKPMSTNLARLLEQIEALRVRDEQPSASRQKAPTKQTVSQPLPWNHPSDPYGALNGDGSY